MNLAEYKALDPETRRATWDGMGEDERAALKAEKLGRAPAAPMADEAAAAVEGGSGIATEAVNSISQSLGATVGRHLRQALVKAAAATGLTVDEITARLMEGEDLDDLGLEETATLKAAANKLRGRRIVPPQVQVQPPQPQAMPQEPMPQAQGAMPPQMPQMPPQGQPQPQLTDLISLMGGA